MSQSLRRQSLAVSADALLWSERRLHVVFDLESLLLDFRPAVFAAIDAAVAAVRRPLGQAPAATPMKPWLRDVLVSRLGSDDPLLLRHAHQHFREAYARLGADRAELREDAHELLELMARPSALCWHYLSTRGVDAACALIYRHGLSEHLAGLHTPWKPAPPGARPQLLGHLLQGDMAGVRHCAVLSDCPYELWMAAEMDRQGVALGYGQHDPASLSAAQAEHWARDCSDVVDWLRRRQMRLAPPPLMAARRLH